MRTATYRSSLRRLAAFNQSPAHYRPFSLAPFLSQSHPTGQDAETSAATELVNDAAGSIGRGGRRRLTATSKAKTGIPDPPRLPEWFLTHNVKLRPSEHGRDITSSNTRVLRLTIGDSATPVLEIPFTPRPELPEAVSLSTPSSLDKVISSLQPGRAADPKTSTATFSETSWAKFHAHLLLSSSFTACKARPDVPSAHRGIILRSQDERLDSTQLDERVESLAALSNAHLIRIDANDISELAGDYIDGDNRESGSVSALGFDTYDGIRSAKSRLPSDSDQDQDAETDAGEADVSASPIDIRDFVKRNHRSLSEALRSVKVIGLNIGAHDPQSMMPAELSTGSGPARTSKDDVEDGPTLSRWQALKLEGVFDHLLRTSVPGASGSVEINLADFTRHKFQSARNAHTSSVSEFRCLLANMVTASAPHAEEKVEARTEPQKDDSTADSTALRFKNVAHFVDDSRPSPALDPSTSRLVIHVRDIDAIRETSQGDVIIKRLVKVVAKRRKLGDAIVLVGTSYTGQTGVMSLDKDPEDDEFLQIPYLENFPSLAAADFSQGMSTPASMGRAISNINLRNIREHARQLGFRVARDIFSPANSAILTLAGTSQLCVSVMSQAQVHEMVLIADGLRSIYTTSSELNLGHLALTMSLPIWHHELLDPSISSFEHSAKIDAKPRIGSEAGATRGSRDISASQTTREATVERIEHIKRTALQHEKNFLSGIIDHTKIKTSFQDVHAPAKTVDALKTVTTLALIRPDAFEYGILAKSRLSGLLLYGPPGTGKTLLAKAVAKDANAVVLEVSGAQIYQKYVGESEKLVRALFALAKKLSPCIVFIDEGDAIFGTRTSQGQSSRSSHREIINQFLREWDGMDDHQVFIMVATNRPFDLDDAVLRRLPRRILVDLPTVTDRESILRIHLREETLAEELCIKDLAKRTPFFSGSDLKNLCVAAALTAVKEENALLEQNKDTTGFELPKKRTLTGQHFDRALQEISASISEDMRSLKDIKKFDEQFGDAAGKTKKRGFGFGEGAAVGQESDVALVRDRQDEARP